MNLHVAATKHCYLAIRCDCGQETIARPATGLCSHVEGRRRDLQMSERCLVGPMLATFIAALSLRFRLSRVKIAEFLVDWLGVELGVATIERCIHEFGLASEPVVEQLIEEVRVAEIVHLDETPWYQKATLLWLWVAVTATTIVYRIGSRKRCELAALIGDAFLGWLITDGYGAYRDHPRRQRCLAHLIRKARALAEGHYGAGSGFGRDLVRDLRRLIERVHDGDDPAAIMRLTARIKWNCQCNRHEIETKVRGLAGEILNDWDAVIAFVADPDLPPSRVGNRRGGGSLPVGFRRCFRTTPSVRAGVAPFPVAARQTGRADFPHPAFSRPIRPSHSAGRRAGAGRHRGRVSDTDTRPGSGGTRCPFVRYGASTSGEPGGQCIGG